MRYDHNTALPGNFDRYETEFRFEWFWVMVAVAAHVSCPLNQVAL